MRAVLWVRTHPYTAATPIVAAALTGLFILLTGTPWWECALSVLALFAVAFWKVWCERRRAR